MNSNSPTNPPGGPEREGGGVVSGISRRDFLKLSAAGTVVAAGASLIPYFGRKVEAAGGPFGDSGVEMESGRRSDFPTDSMYSIDPEQDGKISLRDTLPGRRGSLPVEKTGVSALVERDGKAYRLKPGLPDSLKNSVTDARRIDVYNIADGCDLLMIIKSEMGNDSSGVPSQVDKKTLVVAKKDAGGKWSVTDVSDWKNMPLPDKWKDEAFFPVLTEFPGYSGQDKNEKTAAFGYAVSEKTADGKLAWPEKGTIVWRVNSDTGKIEIAYHSEKYEIWEDVQAIGNEGTLVVKARTRQDGKGWSKKLWDAKWYDAQGNVVRERAPTHVMVVDKNNQTYEIPQESADGMLEDVTVGPDGALWVMRRQSPKKDTRGTVKIIRADAQRPSEEKIVFTVTPPDASIVKPAGGAFAYAADTSLLFGRIDDRSMIVTFAGYYDGGVDPREGDQGSVKIGLDIAMATVDMNGNMKGTPFQAHLSEPEISQWSSQVIEGRGSPNYPDGVPNRYGKSVRKAYYISLNRVIPNPETGDIWVKLRAETGDDGTFYDIFKLAPVNKS